MKASNLFLWLVAARILNALFVRTFFSPDEQWQSVEVAHWHVFGYGHLTWEWQPEHRLRSYLHPLLFSAVFWVLKVLHLDTREAVVWMPRLIQGIACARADLAVYRIAHRMYGAEAARWALACMLNNWFIIYAGVRTFSNAAEMVLLLVAIEWWREDEKGNKWSFAVAGVACLVRPTAAIVVVCMVALDAGRGVRRLVSLTKDAVPVAIAVLTVGMLVDRWFYGAWTLAPWNFLRFNVLDGDSAFYGIL